MKRRNVIFIILVLLWAIVTGIYYYFDTEEFQTIGKLKVSTKILTNLSEKVEDNSIWCGTFQLVWNELKEEYNAGNSIMFTAGNTTEVDNLNASIFTKDNLNDNSYYLKHGLVNSNLKKEIEVAIKNKFNEESDILDGFDWTPGKDKYIIYSMLIKNVEFIEKFEKLKNGKFNDTDNVKYFGIEEKQKELKDQVNVLFYDDNENFAVELITKTDDVIILEKGSNKNTFLEIYNEVMAKSKKYKNHSFTEEDYLSVPFLETNLKQQFKQFVGKEFIADGEQYTIDDAIQTIKFKIDESGAKLKSEAGIIVEKNGIDLDSRHFDFDTDFTLFMKEDNLPYFAIRVSDINEFQEIAIKE